MKPIPLVFLWGYLTAVDKGYWSIKDANSYAKYVASKSRHIWKEFNL